MVTGNRITIFLITLLCSIQSGLANKTLPLWTNEITAGQIYNLFCQIFCLVAWCSHNQCAQWTGFKPWPGTLCELYSWAGHFNLTVPVSTQVYKWVPANLMLEVTLRWTSIPSRGE